MIEARLDTQKFDKLLGKLTRQSINTTPLMRRLSGDLMDSTEENFEQQGRPKWAPLAQSTIRARKAKGKTGKILQVSGSLATSIHPRWSRETAVAGTNNKYAKTHQFGHTFPAMFIKPKNKKALSWIGPDGKRRFSKGHKIGERKIPARPFFRLTKGDLREIHNHSVDWLLMK